MALLGGAAGQSDRYPPRAVMTPLVSAFFAGVEDNGRGGDDFDTPPSAATQSSGSGGCGYAIIGQVAAAAAIRAPGSRYAGSARYSTTRWGGGGQSWEVLVGDGLGFVGGDDVEAAAGQDVEAEVAASFGPLVGLLGQDPSEEAGDGVAAGKIPTESVRRRISLLRRSLGLLGQIWTHTSLGKAVKASRSSHAASRCWATAWSLSHS